jgi:hypothetical protein
MIRYLKPHTVILLGIVGLSEYANIVPLHHSLHCSLLTTQRRFRSGETSASSASLTANKPYRACCGALVLQAIPIARTTTIDDSPYHGVSSRK